MADDAENKQGRPTSIRRRLTTSIKRVMSIGSKKSTKSGSSTPTPSSPSVGQSAPPKLSSPPPEEPVKAASPMSPHSHSPRPYHPPYQRTTSPPVLTVAERAQALFNKYGVDIKTNEWPIPCHPQIERVHKEIRMRVRRTCHKCQTTYGVDKECAKCGHRRCRACPRYPVKKHKSKEKSKDKGKGKEKVPTKPKMGYKKRRGDTAYGLTIPSRRGGPDLVYKKIRQRVHRTCHRCHKDFACDKRCTNCGHTRCKICPRIPIKGDRPLEDYNKHDPDDSESEYSPPPRRTFKRPRRRVHWACLKCHSTFIEKCKICPGCGSNRDDTGIRDPHKKTRHHHSIPHYHHPPHHHHHRHHHDSSEDDVQDLNNRLRLAKLSD